MSRSLSAPAAALCIALAGSGCASMMSGYQKAANAHGPRFTVHRDSAEACWDRAYHYLERSFSTTAPIETADEEIIQTEPALAPGSIQFTITRTDIGDSVRIIVDFDYTKINNYDIFGPATAMEQVNDIAFHAHHGWESHNMPKTLVPGYVAGSPMEPEKEAPKEGSIWVGTSYGKRNWGGELGMRYLFIGASVSFADLRNAGTTLPEHEEFNIPHTSYRTHSYPGSFMGWNLYAFWDITEDLALYGSGGYYYRPIRYLDQSTVTRTYYESFTETTYTETRWGGGLGVHYGLARWLVLGAGYSSINDATLHIGGRF